jgi:hypothetical protein
MVGLYGSLWIDEPAGSGRVWRGSCRRDQSSGGARDDGSGGKRADGDKRVERIRDEDAKTWSVARGSSRFARQLHRARYDTRSLPPPPTGVGGKCACLQAKPAPPSCAWPSSAIRWSPVRSSNAIGEPLNCWTSSLTFSDCHRQRRRLRRTKRIRRWADRGGARGYETDFGCGHSQRLQGDGSWAKRASDNLLSSSQSSHQPGVAQHGDINSRDRSNAPSSRCPRPAAATSALTDLLPVVPERSGSLGRLRQIQTSLRAFDPGIVSAQHRQPRGPWVHVLFAHRTRRTDSASKGTRYQ